MTKILLLKVLFKINFIQKKVNYKYITKQHNLLLFFLFLFSIFISFSSISQQIESFKNTANIYSIIQDEKDFIWLSGQNGLYRFDGSKTINFSNNNNNNNWSIPFNWINNSSLKDDKLILATETKGLWLFDPDTGTSTPIKIKSQSSTFYNAIHHENSFYAVSRTPQHLYRYEITTGETTILMKNIKNNTLLASSNRVYFNDKEKLYYINSTDNNSKIQYITDINERVITATSTDDIVIIATKNNLYKLSDTGAITKEKTFSPTLAIAISNNKKNFFTIDRSGKIIKRELATLKIKLTNFPSVEKSRYHVLLHDNSGVLWLVSNSGVKQLTENTVKNLPVIFDTNHNLLETEIYANQFYIGSYGKGVHILSNIKKNKITPLKNINQKLSNKALKITDLLAVNKTLFMATFDGLWRYNKKNQQTQKINLSFENIDLSNLILLKLKHRNNLLYIATDQHGLIVYDVNKEKVILHIEENKGLSSGEVIDILPLTNGDIWLATGLGLDIIRNSTNTVTTINNQISTKFISLLYADGKIFAATKGDGIFVYNQQGQQLTHFAHGLNFSYMSLFGENIYASAMPGLYKINPIDYQISMITNTENFSFTDSPISYKDSIFIANTLGILQLPRTTEAPFHPKVYISKTTVSGKPYLLNKTINIASGNDVITLELASLDYRPGITKQYRYTLNDNIWHQISGNQLTLTGLASGNYHIEIMATNSLGQWSDNKAYTEISVAFPWYWTPQIRLVYALILLCFVCFSAWLFYLRSRSIRHIHNILQTDISNYGKTSMQIKRNLTVSLAMLSENEIEKSKALLQQCVDDLNQQQKSPEPNTLNGNLLTVAIPFLAKYLQQKYQAKLSFQLDINESELEYELKADLYRVVFEAITSAILKGSGRKFKVVIQKFKTKIWLNISDDNQSFIHFNSKINVDISMYYISQIANKYNGSINTFNEQGNGSQLILSIPVVNNYHTPRNSD
jgi:ligand-binding sensor domain-containing protein